MLPKRTPELELAYLSMYLYPIHLYIICTILCTYNECAFLQFRTHSNNLFINTCNAESSYAYGIKLVQ